LKAFGKAVALLWRVMNLVCFIAAIVLGFAVWDQTGSAGLGLLACMCASGVLGLATGADLDNLLLEWGDSDSSDGGGDGGGGGD
jgi:hypothetical protein